jgi:hypothetical protein
MTRLTSFSTLRTISFVHSTVFAALLLVWLGPHAPTAKLVLGWTHGLLWIGMSLLVVVAARRRTIPFGLAAVVAIVGGVGPFAGTIGFIVVDRRRAKPMTV